MENAMKYMVVLLCVILLFFNDITVSVLCEPIRERRQAAPAYNDDYADGNDNDKKDEDTKDYKSPDAGAEDIVDDAPADNAYDKDKSDDTLKDTADDAIKETAQDTDKDFGGDDFTAAAPASNPKPAPKQTSASSEELKKLKAELEKLKKANKRKKFVKDVLNYLKKVLTPQNLMQNQWVIQMLRRFSNSADDDYKSVESVENKEQPAKKRRGRPRGRKTRKKIPRGLKGLIAYGLRSMTEIDRRKLRRNLRYVRRFARKAKKPLKAAVRMFLSSRTNGDTGGDGGMGGGGGGGGYGNTY